MGHLINPLSTRLGLVRIWNSNWSTFSNNLKYTYLLNNDLYIFSIIRLYFSYNHVRKSPSFKDMILSHLYILRNFSKVVVICYIYDATMVSFDFAAFHFFKRWLKKKLRKKKFIYKNKRLLIQRVNNFNNVINKKFITQFKLSFIELKLKKNKFLKNFNRFYLKLKWYQRMCYNSFSFLKNKYYHYYLPFNKFFIGLNFNFFSFLHAKLVNKCIFTLSTKTASISLFFKIMFFRLLSLEFKVIKFLHKIAFHVMFLDYDKSIISQQILNLNTLCSQSVLKYFYKFYDNFVFRSEIKRLIPLKQFKKFKLFNRWKNYKKFNTNKTNIVNQKNKINTKFFNNLKKKKKFNVLKTFTKLKIKKKRRFFVKKRFWILNENETFLHKLFFLKKFEFFRCYSKNIQIFCSFNVRNFFFSISDLKFLLTSNLLFTKILDSFLYFRYWFLFLKLKIKFKKKQCFYLFYKNLKIRKGLKFSLFRKRLRKKFLKIFSFHNKQLYLKKKKRQIFSLSAFRVFFKKKSHKIKRFGTYFFRLFFLFKRKNFFFFFKLKNQNKRKVFKYKKFKAAQTLLARFGYCFNHFIKLKKLRFKKFKSIKFFNYGYFKFYSQYFFKFIFKFKNISSYLSNLFLSSLVENKKVIGYLSFLLAFKSSSKFSISTLEITKLLQHRYNIYNIGVNNFSNLCKIVNTIKI